ncbi:MAG: nucleoside recognition protein [Deltaproteobacteria bacterium]|nr:nucleoside recognition protein [Deltaproteobacteria bacterium]
MSAPACHPHPSAAPASPAGPPWRAALAKAWRRGRSFLWFLLRMVLPLYVLTEVLVRSGALAWVSRVFAPLMGLWGLPPEAAAVVSAGMLVNLYAAAAVAAPLGLTWQQMSVLGLMLGISHSLFMEAVVVRELAPRHHVRLNVLRVGLGCVAAWLLHLVLP